VVKNGLGGWVSARMIEFVREYLDCDNYYVPANGYYGSNEHRLL